MNTKVFSAFKRWYSSLETHKASGGPARGTIAASLVVLEHLKEAYDLDLDAHRAKGGAQIIGLSPGSVAKILERFDETRPFLKEGGRTNRGGPGDIKKLLATLKDQNLDKLQAEERNAALNDLQAFLVERVRDFHNRQRLRYVYEPAKTTWQAIHELLLLAQEKGKEGMVAQYLVGAKLALRFPEIEIQNLSYSTADAQLGRPGDFHVGTTAFHVTVAPMPAVFDKCKANIEQGFRVYLIVPDRAFIGARQNANAIVADRIAVESIESFVANNIEELSLFTGDKVKDGFRRLLEQYNCRVDQVENDKSLLIEIPKNLT